MKKKNGDMRHTKPDEFKSMKPNKVGETEPPSYNEMGKSRVNKAQSEWASNMNSKKRE